MFKKSATPILADRSGTLVAPGVVVPAAPVMPDAVTASFTHPQHRLRADTDTLLGFEAFSTMAWKLTSPDGAAVSEFMLTGEWDRTSGGALAVTFSESAAADLVSLPPLAPIRTSVSAAETRLRALTGSDEVFSTPSREVAGAGGNATSGGRYWDAKRAALGDQCVCDESSVTETVTTVGVSSYGVAVCSSMQAWARRLTFAMRSDAAAAVGNMVPAVVTAVSASDTANVSSSAITLHTFDEISDLRIDVSGDDVVASFKIDDRSFHVGAETLRAIQSARAATTT